MGHFTPIRRADISHIVRKFSPSIDKTHMVASTLKIKLHLQHPAS